MTTLGPPSSSYPPKQSHDDAHPSSPILAVALAPALPIGSAPILGGMDGPRRIVNG